MYIQGPKSRIRVDVHDKLREKIAISKYYSAITIMIQI